MRTAGLSICAFLSLLLLAGSSAGAGAYRSAVLADGPVAYWRLGETAGTVAHDETNAHDGTYRGAVGLGAAGPLDADPDTAVALNGADEGIVVGDAPSLEAGAGDFAVEAWLQTTVNNEQVVIVKDAYVAEPFWQLTITNDVGFVGRPRMKIFDGSTDLYAYGPTRVDDGNWHHVVVDVDRDVGVTVYVDAQAAATRLPTPRTFETSGNLLIGHARDPYYPDYRGSLDEVAVYRTLLGANAVERHLAVARDGTAPTVTLTSPAAASRTNDATPTFAGKAGVDPDDVSTVIVKVYPGNAPTGTPLATLAAPVAADGSYAVSTESTLPDGTYTARAEQSDRAGNIGRSTAETFMVDTQAPTITLTSPRDGSVISDRTPAFGGRAGVAAGDTPTVTVNVFRGGTAGGTPLTVLTAAAAADGTFTTRPAAALEDGTYTAKARQDDAAGNTSSSAATTFVVRTQSGYASAVLADEPVGYWRLGEATGSTAADELGRNAGTYRGAVTLGLPGAFTGDSDTSAGFDGVDAGVDLGDGAGLDVGLNDFAIEAWVKTTANGEQTIVGKAGTPAWELTVSDDPGREGRPRMKVFDGLVNEYAYGPARVDDGTWHHIVADVDRDAGITVYVNTAPATTALLTPLSFATDATLQIAAGAEHPHFKGSIDEVALYPSLLGAARVDAHYRLQLAAPGELFWSGDMETGDLSQWGRDGGGGEYNNGIADSTVSAEQARSGSYSAKLTVTAPPDAGTRLFRWNESRANRDAVYSAWFYFPQALTRTANYFNLLQFKSRGTPNPDGDPFWFIDLVNDGLGGLKPTLIWWDGLAVEGPHQGESGFRRYQPLVPVRVPVGRWFNVSCRLYQSNAFDGALSCEWDGQRIFDLSGIKTAYVNCTYNSWCANNEVSFNNYSDGLLPTPATFYVDDVTISSAPAG